MDYTKAPTSPSQPPVIISSEPLTESTVRYGGFWIRFLAQFIDNMILFTAGAIVYFILMMIDPYGEYDNLSLGSVGAAYFIIFTASKHMGTPGKSALGLAVVDNLGKRISIGRSFGRYVCFFLSFMTVFVGFIIAAFTKRKQALHDLICQTYVIRTKAWSAVNIFAIISLPLIISLLVMIFVPEDPYDASLDRADKLIDTEKYAPAITILGDSINKKCMAKHKRNNFDCGKALHLRGFAHHMLDQPDLAFADYNRALQLNPNDVEILRVRAFTYYGTNEYEKGIADLNKAVAIEPKNIETYFYRTLLYYAAGEYERAFIDMKTAKSIRGSDSYFIADKDPEAVYSIFQSTFPEKDEGDTKDYHRQILELFHK